MTAQSVPHEIHATFISEKVNKIRWKPDPFNNSNWFVTGSWDNISNLLTLWGFQENENDAGITPYTVSTHNIKGDCTEIQFINPDYFLSSTSQGSISLYKIATDAINATSLETKTEWDRIHHFENGEESPCTSFASYGEDTVTIGEDGRINLLTMQRKEVIKSIDNADSCSLNCVTFLKFNEILTGNIRGQMKIWDLRDKESKPTSSFMLSGDQVPATCLAQHPTQRHMVVAGDEEGALTVWDLRQNTFPVNLLTAHSDVVSEIQFHPDYPDLLCSSSLSGELWLWKTVQSKQRNPLLSMEETEVSPWFSTDIAKNKLEIFWLMPRVYMPINSLDMNRNRVLCGCDSEAIYLVTEINMLG